MRHKQESFILQGIYSWKIRNLMRLISDLHQLVQWNYFAACMLFGLQGITFQIFQDLIFYVYLRRYTPCSFDINWKVEKASWLVASELFISYSCGIKHCWSCFLLVEDNSGRIVIIMYPKRKTCWSFRKRLTWLQNQDSGDGNSITESAVLRGRG